MGGTRKEFLKKSAYLAALSAVGLRPKNNSVFNLFKKDKTEDTEWMKLSMAHWRPQKKRMELAKMMGVAGAVSGAGEDPAARKKEFGEAGLEWAVCEGVRLDRAQLGIEGKDRDIENFVELMKKLSDVGQNIICYNWMPIISWARTNKSAPGRGKSTVMSFDYDEIKDNSLTKYGSFSKETMWENLEYFLDAVVPEAEKYGIKLAMHADDPPVAQMRGISRIMTSIDAFKRLIEIHPSPNNGITFSQGALASTAPDAHIPEAIRYFGERNKIFFVHFRDVRGHNRHFTEAWHDNGKTDMCAAMQAYYDVGFRGPIRPDHVPTITGYEKNDFPGYNDLGTLFAIGYMKGLMEVIAKDSA